MYKEEDRSTTGSIMHGRCGREGTGSQGGTPLLIEGRRGRFPRGLPAQHLEEKLFPAGEKHPAVHQRATGKQVPSLLS